MRRWKKPDKAQQRRAAESRNRHKIRRVQKVSFRRSGRNNEQGIIALGLD